MGKIDTSHDIAIGAVVISGVLTLAQFTFGLFFYYPFVYSYILLNIFSNSGSYEELITFSITAYTVIITILQVILLNITLSKKRKGVWLHVVALVLPLIPFAMNFFDLLG